MANSNVIQDEDSLSSHFWGFKCKIESIIAVKKNINVDDLKKKKKTGARVLT